MAGTHEYWFRRTYNLPPNDPRFLDATHEEIVLEYYARLSDDRRLAGKPDEEEFEDDDFDLDAAVAAMESDNPDDWIKVP